MNFFIFLIKNILTNKVINKTIISASFQQKKKKLLFQHFYNKKNEKRTYVLQKHSLYQEIIGKIINYSFDNQI